MLVLLIQRERQAVQKEGQRGDLNLRTFIRRSVCPLCLRSLLDFECRITPINPMDTFRRVLASDAPRVRPQEEQGTQAQREAGHPRHAQQEEAGAVCVACGRGDGRSRQPRPGTCFCLMCVGTWAMLFDDFATQL